MGAPGGKPRVLPSTKAAPVPARGVWIWGAVGAAWALAITEIALLPLWFIRLRTAVRSVRDDSAAATPTEAHTEDHQPYAVCVEPRIG